jgi:hypothetical protein
MITPSLLLALTILIITTGTVSIVNQEAFAQANKFKVDVILTGVDSQTGRLYVSVLLSGSEVEQTRIVDPYKDGRAATVNLEDFVFDAADIEEGELIDVCVESLDFPQLERNCEIGEDTPANKPETIRVEVPSGIGKNPETSIIETPPIIENDPEPYELIEEDGTVITVYPDPEKYEDPPVTDDDNPQSSPYDD